MDDATKAARHHIGKPQGREIAPGRNDPKKNAWRMHPWRFI
jgi:hypothetical protein